MLKACTCNPSWEEGNRQIFRVNHQPNWWAPVQWEPMVNKHSHWRWYLMSTTYLQTQHPPKYKDSWFCWGFGKTVKTLSMVTHIYNPSMGRSRGRTIAGSVMPLWLHSKLGQPELCNRTLTNNKSRDDGSLLQSLFRGGRCRWISVVWGQINLHSWVSGQPELHSKRPCFKKQNKSSM